MTNYSSPPDQQQRELALKADASFVVRAPAGSGKTTLLVARYLHLLNRVQQPEEILAITFTRKAAAEMRARVIEQLSSGNDEYSNAARQANINNKWKLLENPNRLKIQTIDSFNSTLANSFPVQSRQSPDISVSESSQELYKLAAQNLFNHLYSNSEGTEASKTQADIIADLLALLGNDFAHASRLIEKMLSKRDQWLEHTANILREVFSSEKTEDEVVNRLFQLGISQLNTRTTDLFMSVLSESQKKELEQLIQFSNSNLEENDGVKDGLPESPVQWRALGELLTIKTGAPRKTVTKAQGFPSASSKKNAHNQQMKERMLEFLHSILPGIPGFKNLRIVPDITLPKQEARHLFTLCAGLSLAALELDKVFSKQRKMDYTQMSIAAMQALGNADNVTDIALALDYRINHLLIDEYQDTSWFQNKLIKRLTREWLPDQRRTFFAVGDPMQSIYRFRDAEVALFLRSTKMKFGAASPKAITLTANFRSSPGLVDWFNTVFAQSFGDSADSNLGKVPYQSAISARPDLANKLNSGVTLDVFEGENAKASEAKSIARQISALQRTNPDTSIAVLVRSRTHISELVRELDAGNIPWQGTDIDSLKEEPVVMDMLSIVKILWQTETLIPCLAFLRSPIVGLQLHDLLKISQYFHQQSALGINAIDALIAALPQIQLLALSKQANAALARVEASLLKACEKVGIILPRQIIEQLWIRLGGFEIYNSGRSGRASIKLLDLIEKQAEEGSLYELDIPKLLLNVEALYLENIPREGSVQLMTIHKSKGLQFEHVFLPSLTSTTRARDKELLRWRPDGDALLMASSLNNTPGSLYAWLDAEDAEREANETRRLLYVACTRACLSLHLSGCLNPDKTPAKNSLLATIWDSIELAVIRHKPDSTATAEDKNVQHKAVEYRRLPQPYLWRPPANTASDLFLGKHSTTFKKNSKSELETGEKNQHNSPEIILGILVHEILYGLSRKMPSNVEHFVKQSTKIWRTRLLQLTRQLPEKIQDHDLLLTRATTQIRGILADTDGKWLLSSDHTESLSEAPFTGFYSGALVNIIIDRTFLDKNGTRWLIDYKSSQKPDSVDITDFVSQQVQWHHPQLKKYATLLSAWKPGPLKVAIYFTALPRFHILESIL